MSLSPHNFSIPVMGTGHSIDSPIRVGPYGINSVISIVDDLLVEKIRKYYCKKYDFEYNGLKLKISMTFGVSAYQKGNDIEQCIKQADDALLEGKRAGKNCVMVYRQ